jgi:tetratricopeptide (TPR) repeat protein
MPLPLNKSAAIGAELVSMVEKGGREPLSEFELYKFKQSANELSSLRPAQGLFFLARYEQLIGNYDKAWELSEKAYAACPHDSMIIANCANLAASLEKYDESITMHQEALQIHPENIGYIHNLLVTANIAGRKDIFDFWLQKYYRLTGEEPNDNNFTGVRMMKGNSIYALNTKIKEIKFKKPIHTTISKDDDAYFADCVEFPTLYGVGNTVDEAGDMLFNELYSLYIDLMEDDNFSQEYLTIKQKFLDMVEA